MFRPEISIIAPVFEQADYIDEFCESVRSSTSHLRVNVELILVDDGSRDSTWKKITELCQTRRTGQFVICGVRLTRNFGQHSALFAGLSKARGKFHVTMDGDLQDDPEYIPQLLQEIDTGAYVVHARREHNIWNYRSWLSRFVYWLLTFRGEMKRTKVFGNYKLLRTEVTEDLIALQMPYPLLEYGLQYLGYPDSSIPYQRRKAVYSKSRYSKSKIFRFMLSIILNYSSLPFWAVAFLIPAVLIAIYRLWGNLTLQSSTSIPVFFSLWFVSAVSVFGAYFRTLQKGSRKWPAYVILECTEGFDENGIG